MNPSNSGQGDGQGRAILGKPFTLSAAAPEFFPRNYVPQTRNGMGMNQNTMYQQQQHQPQMYMQQQMPPQHHGMYSVPPNQRHPYNPQYQGRHPGPRGGHQQAPPPQPTVPTPPDPMSQLKQAILILTKDPGNFDDLMPELTSSLDSSIHTEERLIKMVEDIFRQSVEEANFRYTGARICNYFSHHLSVKFESGTFRQHLLKRCREEHKKRDDLVKNCDHRYKLVGFTLFMGELLLNLKEFVKVNDSSEYLRVIAQAMQELLQTLLSQPADDTLRCVVQVLKLCGAVLEDAERDQSEKSEAPEVDGIFAILKESVLENSYHKGLRAQILSVIELRASSWGRPSSSPPSQASAQPPAPAPAPSNPPPPTQGASGQANNFSNMPPQANNPMYFPQDPSGQVGGDVDQFGNFYPDDLYYYSSGEEDWQNQEELMYMYNGIECIQEDEMDPEIAAAYEEFLNNQKQ